MRVRDCMTEKVFTVSTDKKLLIAEEIMDWARVRHVPVVDDQNRLVGLISHRDLLRASLSSLSGAAAELRNRQHLAKISIDMVMRTDVTTIDADASIRAAARLMRNEKRGCLPVVTSRNELVGIITEHDLLGILEHVDLGTVEPVSGRSPRP